MEQSQVAGRKEKALLGAGRVGGVDEGEKGGGEEESKQHLFAGRTEQAQVADKEKEKGMVGAEWCKSHRERQGWGRDGLGGGRPSLSTTMHQHMG